MEGLSFYNRDEIENCWEDFYKRQRKIDVEDILSNFGEERDLSNIPINTTFLGIDDEYFIHKLAIVEIDNEKVLLKEVRLNEVYEKTYPHWYKSFIFITNNDKGLEKSHWYRSVPICKDAKIKVIKTEFINLF